MSKLKGMWKEKEHHTWSKIQSRDRTINDHHLFSVSFALVVALFSIFFFISFESDGFGITGFVVSNGTNNDTILNSTLNGGIELADNTSTTNDSLDIDVEFNQTNSTSGELSENSAGNSTENNPDLNSSTADNLILSIDEDGTDNNQLNATVEGHLLNSTSVNNTSLNNTSFNNTYLNTTEENSTTMNSTLINNTLVNESFIGDSFIDDTLTEEGLINDSLNNGTLTDDSIPGDETNTSLPSTGLINQTDLQEPEINESQLDDNSLNLTPENETIYEDINEGISNNSLTNGSLVEEDTINSTFNESISFQIINNTYEYSYYLGNYTFVSDFSPFVVNFGTNENPISGIASSQISGTSAIFADSYNDIMEIAVSGPKYYLIDPGQVINLRGYAQLNNGTLLPSQTINTFTRGKQYFVDENNNLVVEDEVFGDGSDGDVVISATTTINTYSYVPTATTNAGSTSIVVSSAAAFMVDDEIMIYQSQYTSTAVAGQYEFVRIASVNTSTNTLYLQTPLTYTYYSGNPGRTGSRTSTQVVRVPQFNTLTVNSGVSIVPTTWTGSYGGLLVFRVKDRLEIVGGISATTRGHAGGNSRSSGSNHIGSFWDGYRGESYYGCRTSTYYGRCGPAGGAGQSGWGGSGNPTGGGGGGHRSYGNSASSRNGEAGGQGGSSIGDSQLTRIYMGGSGGSGGSHDTWGTAYTGGYGGGIVLFNAKHISGAGSITSNGGTPSHSSGTFQGGGGGGAGGSVWVTSYNSSFGSVTATYGSGSCGTVSSGARSCGSPAGGNGAYGRIRMDYGLVDGAYNTNHSDFGFINSPATDYTRPITVKGDRFGDYNVSLAFYDWGIHNITFETQYLDGNGDVHSGMDYVVVDIRDYEKPSVVVNRPSDGDIINDSINVVLSFNASDNVGSVENCTLTINGTPRIFYDNVVNGGTTSTRFELMNGVYNWAVRCYDRYGNYNQTPNQTITVDVNDTVGPTINLLNITDGSIFDYTNLTFVFTAEDNNSNIDVCSLHAEGQIREQITTVYNLYLESKNNSMIHDFRNGVYNWWISCNDSFGNIGTSVVRTFTMDSPYGHRSLNLTLSIGDYVEIQPMDTVFLNGTLSFLNGTTLPNHFIEPYLAGEILLYDEDGNLVESEYYFGDGSDGDLVVSGATINIDSIKTSLSSNANAGAYTFTVANSGSFTVEDEILIINQQGANAGVYEIAEIVAINGNAITVKSALKNTYYSAQDSNIIKVMEYNNVDVINSGYLSASYWNGAIGGIAAMKVKGRLYVDSSSQIYFYDRGYRGGAGYGYGRNSVGDGLRGENWYQYLGSFSRSQSNGAGGSGDYRTCSGGGDTGGGGAGGGHGSSGANGGYTCGANSYGGATYGISDLSRIYFGSGGGAGAGDNANPYDSNYGYGGGGGSGGGAVIIFANRMEVRGYINANGRNGRNAYDPGDAEPGSGGAGAGGSIYIKTSDLSFSFGSIVANGGIRGTVSGDGGNGGVGRIRIDYITVNGDMSTTNNDLSTHVSPTPGYTEGMTLRTDGIAEYNTNFTFDKIGVYEIVLLTNYTEGGLYYFGTQRLVVNVTDLTPPVIDVFAPSNNSMITENINIDFVFNVSDVLSNISRCDVLVNGSVVYSNTSVNEYTIQNYTTALLNGNYYWAIGCYDDYGNYAENGNYQIDVNVPDLAGPTITVVNYPNATFRAFNDVNFTFYAYDDQANVEACNLYVDGSLNRSLTNPINAYDNYELNNFLDNFPDGTYVWRIDCNDSFGNIGTTGDVTLIVNYIEPVNWTYLVNDLNADAYIERFGSVEANVTLVQPKNSNISLWLDGVLVAKVINGETLVYNVEQFYEERFYNLTAVLENYWGQDYEIRHWVIVGNDTQGPTIDVISPYENEWINDQPITFEFDADDNFKFTMSCNYSVNDVFIAEDVINPLRGYVSFDRNDLTEGYHNYWNISCKDWTNNTNSVGINFNVDRSKPAINLSTEVAGQTIYDVTPDILFSVTDFWSPMINYTIILDGLVVDSAWVQNRTVINYTFNYIAAGMHTMEIWAYDLAGNNHTTGPLTFTIDGSYVQLMSPIYAAYVNSSDINYIYRFTDDNFLEGNCTLFINGNYIANKTVSTNSLQSFFNDSLPEGLNQNWAVECDTSLYTRKDTNVIHADYTKPFFDLITVTPPTIANYTTAQTNIDVTVRDVSDVTAIIEHNFTANATEPFVFDNITCSQTVPGKPATYSCQLDIDLPPGDYSFRIIAKDKVGFTNTSDWQSHTVVRAEPVIVLNANPSWNVSPGKTTNVECSSPINNLELFLYLDGILVNNGTGVIVNHTAMLDGETYNYTCTNALHQNYSVKSVSNILNKTGIMTLTAVPSWSNPYGKVTTVTCHLDHNETVPRLYFDGDLVSNPHVGTLWVGLWNYSCIADATLNYNATNKTKNMHIYLLNDTVEIYLNSQPMNLTVSYGKNTTAYGTSLTGGHDFYLDGASSVNPHSELLPVGTYDYSIQSYGNGTHQPQSLARRLTIVQAVPNLTLSVNSTWNILADTNATINCTSDTDQYGIELYMNGGLVASGRGVSGNGVSISYGQNFTWGSYLFECRTAGSQNYSAHVVSNTLVGAKPSPQLSLNSASPKGWRIHDGDISNISCTTINNEETPHLHLTNIEVVNPYSILHPVGAYTYMCNISESASFAAENVTRTLYIKYPSSCSFNLTPNPTTVVDGFVADCACTNPEYSQRLYRTEDQFPIDVTHENHKWKRLFLDTYPYECRTEETTNYYSASVKRTLVVGKDGSSVTITTNDTNVRENYDYYRIEARLNAPGSGTIWIEEDGPKGGARFPAYNSFAKNYVKTDVGLYRYRVEYEENDYYWGSSHSTSVYVRDAFGPRIWFTWPAHGMWERASSHLVRFDVEDTDSEPISCCLTIGGVSMGCKSGLRRDSGYKANFTAINYNEGRSQQAVLYCTDSVGNPSSVSRTFNYDFTPPNGTIVSPGAYSITGDATPDIILYAEDNLAPYVTYKIYDNGAYNSGGTITNGTTQTVTLAQLLGTGNRSISVLFEDIAGNQRWSNNTINLYLNGTIVFLNKPDQNYKSWDEDLNFSFTYTGQYDNLTCDLDLNTVISGRNSSSKIGYYTQFELFNLPNNFYTWGIRCYDPLDPGITGYNSRTLTVDNETPQVLNYSCNIATNYTPKNSYYSINVSDNLKLDEIFIEHNFNSSGWQNDTMSCVRNGPETYAECTFPWNHTIGNFSFRYFVNDTVGRQNITEFCTHNISKGLANYVLTLNKNQGDITVWKDSMVEIYVNFKDPNFGNTIVNEENKYMGQCDNAFGCYYYKRYTEPGDYEVKATFLDDFLYETTQISYTVHVWPWTIIFINPTPADNAIVVSNNVTINITYPNNLILAELDFDGIKYPMDIVGNVATYTIENYPYGTYDYNVTIRDQYGTYDNSENRTVTLTNSSIEYFNCSQNISLLESPLDLNLISLVCDPTDRNITTVLEAIDGLYSGVWTFDSNNATDPWKKYDPNIPRWASDLDEMNGFKGYWIQMNAPGNLSVNGTIGDRAYYKLGTSPHDLHLIGYPSKNETPIENEFLEISGQYNGVWEFNTSDSADPWKKYDPNIPAWANDLETLKPTKGYWIHMNSAGLIEVYGAVNSS